jgi:outer membrane protein assembly factor BamB
MTMSTSTTSSAISPARRRRWWVPIVAIAIPVVMFFVVRICFAYELIPEAQMPLATAFFFSMPLALLILAIWWLFFSGFGWATKLIVVLIAVGLPFGFTRIVRHVEVTGRMTPRFNFIWEPDPAEELRRQLQAATTASQEGLPAIDLTIAPTDFPRYRGSECNGVAQPTALAPNWAALPAKVLWQQRCGGGYSGFAVAGNVAVTLEQRDQEEAVVCYDRATGKQRWQFTHPAHFKQAPNMGGNGPRATPTIADGDVFSLGALGDLVCLDGATGKPRWQVNILKDNDAQNVMWGMTGSPLVVGGNVIVNPGVDPANNAGKAVAAYDRKTGAKVWAAGDKPAGYSSPQLAKLAGVDLILLFDGGGLVALNPENGKEEWRHDWKTFSDMNIVQPLVLPGDRVYVSSEAANGGVMLKLDRNRNGWVKSELWQNRNLYSRFANPVAHEGHLYGLCNGALTCVDDKTGKRLWKDGDFGSGQVLLAGDVLIVCSEGGEVATVAADPTGYRELSRQEVFKGKTWNTPALAGNQLFVRNHYEMACLELPASK